MPVKEKSEQIKDNVISYEIRFSKLKQLRIEEKGLLIELHVQDHHQEKYSALPNKLQLSYLAMHPEGYRTWFNFDSNIKCLVTVRFSVKNNYSGTRLSLTEHTQLIYYIFRYRFTEYLKSNSSDDVILHFHHESAIRTNSLYHQVNPHSINAFWPSFNDHTNTKDDVGTNTKVSTYNSTYCHELQLAYDESDEPIEEDFCRCSEWCNISSFYYYNPIFRFLMVQFTNFYIKANANLPSSYMCAVSYLFEQFSKQQVRLLIRETSFLFVLFI